MKYIFLIPVFSTLFFSTCFAEEGVSGFRGLNWGVALDDASAIYPDLKYEGKTPDGPLIYARTNEDKNIGGIKFDFVLYFFKDNLFTAIVARKATDYDFKAYEEFEILKRNISKKYNEGVEIKIKGESGVFEDLTRVTWNINTKKMILELWKDSTVFSSSKQNVLKLTVSKPELNNETGLGF